MIAANVAHSPSSREASSYQLYKKDGTLNYEYVTDMWDYYDKKKDK